MSRLRSLVVAGALASAAVVSGPVGTSAVALLLDPGSGTGTSDGVAPPPMVTLDKECVDGVPAELTVTVSGVDGSVASRVIVRGDGTTEDEVLVPAQSIGPAGLVVTTTLATPLDHGVHAVALQRDENIEGSTPSWTSVAFTSLQLPCPHVIAAPDRLAWRDGPFRPALAAVGFSTFTDPDSSPAPVMFTLDGAEVGSAAPSSDGSVVVHPLLAAVPGCGPHVVRATQPGAPARYAAESLLVVTCPAITANPAVVPEDTLPRPVDVTGDGWDPGQQVQLLVDGVAGPVVTTDDEGAFTVPVPLPPHPCGDLPLTAVQLVPAPDLGSHLAAVPPVTTGAPRASATLVVSCATSTPTPTPTTPTPTPTTPTPTPTDATPPPPELAIDPLLASGGVGTAIGTGFRPGRRVALAWRLPDGTLAPGAVLTVADRKGRFQVQCLVLPHARLGARMLEAVQSNHGDVRFAAAPTLVVAGPMEPGRSRLLGRR